jgi:type I restriction enzyme S subunit
MYSLCDDLSDAADRLASIRDILLPRLMTGTIDVSKLDLDALLEESAA